MNTVSRLLLSPALAARYAWLVARTASTPRPQDAPFAAGPGVDPDRVLIVGAGAAVGWGTNTHSLALPGHVARRLAKKTGRGSHVAAMADPTHRGPKLRNVIESTFLENWDVVVLTLGAAEALTLASPRACARHLDDLVRSVLERARPTARVVVATTPLTEAVASFGISAGAVAERHAAVLADVSRQVCAEHARVTHVELTGGPDHETDRRYEDWAGVLADHVAPLLAAQRARTDSPQRARNRPQPVATRLAAIAETGLVEAEPEAALQAITDRARETFETDGAAFDLVLDDHQWNVISTLGSARPEPLADSFCATTIQSEEAFVVADAWHTDLPVPRNDIRFYAGYPVHTPDGTRIGAICVFDTLPRDVAGLPIEALRGFALDIERELHRRAA